jgi:hypothetical protein
MLQNATHQFSLKCMFLIFCGYIKIKAPGVGIQEEEEKMKKAGGGNNFPRQKLPSRFNKKGKK